MATRNKIGISNIMNNNYREYALHILQSRGIPNYYDFLTNVQRFSIESATKQYRSTLSVIGRTRELGYHHGDQSVDGAIEKMTREFNTGQNILEGDGFFGNHITPESAAPRYTSVRISEQIDNILAKYRNLNNKNDENFYDYFYTDIPIGLLLGATGVAIGFSCKILPRSLKDIQNFLKGNIKTLKPYFNGYNGKITRLSDVQWKFEPTITNEKNIIIIKDVPPLISHEKFLEKLKKFTEEKSVDVLSLGKKDIQYKLTFRGNVNIESIKDSLNSLFSTTYTELILLIKDKVALEYNKIEDYLEDFKTHVELCKLKQFQYEIEQHKFEKSYNEAKLEYLMFMYGNKRKNEEILDFYKKYDKKIVDRLDVIKMRNLTLEEIQKTKDDIKNENNIIKELIQLEKQQSVTYNKFLQKETLFNKIL